MQELEEPIEPAWGSVRLLDGEDPHTAFAEDARHWVRVYEQLFHFRSEVLTRTRARLGTMLPAARHELKAELAIMLREADRLHEALQNWAVPQKRLSASP